MSQPLLVWHPLPTWGVPGSDWWVLGTPLAGQARPEGHTRAAWLFPTLGAWGSGLLLPVPVALAALRYLLPKQPQECRAEMQGCPPPPGPSSSPGHMWLATVDAAGVTLCPTPQHWDTWSCGTGPDGVGRGVWPQATSGRQPDDPLCLSVLGSERKMVRVGRGDSGRGWQ